MYRLIPILLFFSCSTFYIHSDSKLDHFMEESYLFKSGFTGFSMYDLSKQEYIYNCNESRYFIPASTAKLFTFYAAKKLLPDTIDGLRYFETDSVLYFQGTGDPSFLNDTVHTRVFNFLDSTEKQLVYSPTPWNEPKYGSGWAWDDFLYSYQPEKSALPLYGNVLEFIADSLEHVTINPPFFKHQIIQDDLRISRGIKTKREEFKNIFTYFLGDIDSISKREIPFIVSDSLTIKLLSDTLNRPISLAPIDSILPLKQPSIPRDTLLKQMMAESNNFIAEQLILNISQHLYGAFSSRHVYKLINDSLLSDLNQKPRIADGSGLSRYHLATPEHFIYILKQLYSMYTEKDLFGLFAQNGKEGTLKNRLSDRPPFLYAKTGTLSNNHSIVGYMKTRSGKTLAFSFMVNHFRTPLKRVQKHIDQLLYDFYEHYE